MFTNEIVQRGYLQPNFSTKYKMSAINYIGQSVGVLEELMHFRFSQEIKLAFRQ